MEKILKSLELQGFTILTEMDQTIWGLTPVDDRVQMVNVAGPDGAPNYPWAPRAQCLIEFTRGGQVQRRMITALHDSSGAPVTESIYGATIYPIKAPKGMSIEDMMRILQELGVL